MWLCRMKARLLGQSCQSECILGRGPEGMGWISMWNNYKIFLRGKAKKDATEEEIGVRGHDFYRPHLPLNIN